MTNDSTIKGSNAVMVATALGVTVDKYADPTEGEREDLDPESPATRVQWQIDNLRSIASCQRADVCSALSGAARRKARLALAETLRNLRILVHP